MVNNYDWMSQFSFLDFIRDVGKHISVNYMIAKDSVKSGIQIIHLPTASIAAYIRYETSVDEIYDIKILPGLRRPGIVSHSNDTHKLAITTPGDNFWAEEKKKED